MLFADSYNYATLSIVVTAVVVGIVGFWFLSNHSPRFITLLVAFVIYQLSGFLDSLGSIYGESRELSGIVGVVRLVAVGGGIIGVIDALRSRDSSESPSAANDNPPSNDIN
jgi:UDP-N-acetylmuramyl pentapeptide phosphotransferase/UDP-N-acetylglucosamine-1-phosphate transferase